MTEQLEGGLAAPANAQGTAPAMSAEQSAESEKNSRKTNSAPRRRGRAAKSKTSGSEAPAQETAPEVPAKAAPAAEAAAGETEAAEKPKGRSRRSRSSGTSSRTGRGRGRAKKEQPAEEAAVEAAAEGAADAEMAVEAVPAAEPEAAAPAEAAAPEAAAEAPAVSETAEPAAEAQPAIEEKPAAREKSGRGRQSRRSRKTQAAQEKPAAEAEPEARAEPVSAEKSPARRDWSTWSGWADEADEVPAPAAAESAPEPAAEAPAEEESGKDKSASRRHSSRSRKSSRSSGRSRQAGRARADEAEEARPEENAEAAPLFRLEGISIEDQMRLDPVPVDDEETDAMDLPPMDLPPEEYDFSAPEEEDLRFSEASSYEYADEEPEDEPDEMPADEYCALSGDVPGEEFNARAAMEEWDADIERDDMAAEADAEAEAEAMAEAEEEPAEGDGQSKRRRRGRRGGRSHRKSGQPAAQEEEAAPVTQAMAGSTAYPATFERDETDTAAGAAQARHGKRRMYISVLPNEQVEVAITSNGILDEYYLDMLHQKKIKGNIYRGVIVNIDVNLQAAFVDFGAEKDGFLQIDEIHPEYYISPQEYVRGHKLPPIQKVLRIGQEVLVQVVKEPNGSKGAFLTTWISLAGRFLVLTPGQEQIAISRKVHDEEERSRLRELMNGIDPGDYLGVIVRTVSAGVTQTTLKNDLTYLKRTWNEVRRQATGVTAPACVYREPGLVERAVRDYLTDDVVEIWVDNADVAERIKETVAMLFANKKDLVRVHNDTRHSLWERFNLRRQLDQIYSREVLMPSGGRLVFDQTEALMAIDINSGKISCKGNFEHMAFKTNMEAAETIARQLKLRDIGGQVVIDFIEMREHKHVLEVERTLRAAMKNDRARHEVARMSSFGLLELVRQRTGTSAISISMEPCPCCGGTGLRRNLEWQSLQALREISRILRARSASASCRYEMPQELGLYVLNHKRDALKELEALYGKTIEISIQS